ncbi:hypothetical protein [Salinibius halmophilus]|uniref:hypothetical protein n=1 Tax=Salinibius halmophilus TaxID=1853216 RepID=UPI000E661A31|nr:hypothetical protein [Salinibius halmophilus]
MDSIRLIACAAFSCLALTACDETAGATSDPTPTTSPTAITTATPSATPTTVAIVSSEPATAARSIVYLSGMAAESINGDQPVSEAVISITVKDQDLNGATREQTYTATTDDSGAYEVQLQDVGISGEYETFIEVIAQKEGWTDGIKRLTSFSIEDSQTVSADVVMTPELVTVQTVQSDDIQLGTSASQNNELRFTVFSKSNGQKYIVAGQDAAIAAAASGDNQQVDVRLPVNALDDNVNTVIAGIQGFTPADPNQVQSFPGEFVGNGDPSSTNNGVSFADNDDLSDNYRLISTGFAQVRLQDQDGNELAIQESVSASDTSPKIFLALDPATYSTITEDRNLDIDGIQVPIFIYRKGWEFAGNGTLVVDGGSGNYVTYTGTLENIANETGLFVELAITQGNRWIRWVNLDWPVQADGTVSTVDVCFQANVAYAPVAGRDAEPFEGYINITTPDGGRLNSYVAAGAFNSGLQTMTSDRFDTSPNEWQLTAVNRLTGAFEEIDTSAISEVTTGANCNNLGNIQLVNPNQCIVEGIVSKQTDSGTTGQGGQLISISAERYNRRVITGATGYYQAAIPCDTDVEIAPVGGEGQTLAAASNTGVSEVNITFENIKPVIAGVTAPKEAQLTNNGATINIEYTAYDLDSDDITVTLTCEAATSNLAAAPAFIMESGTESCTVQAAGDYQWTLEVEDGVSTTSKSGKFTVYAPEQNRPPRVRLIMANDVPLPCTRNTSGTLVCEQVLLAGTTQVSYAAIATDGNGNAMTYSWNNATATANNTHEQIIDSSLEVDLQVTDNHPNNALSDTAIINVEVKANEPPQLRQLFNANGDIALTEVDGNYQNSEVVNFTAIVFDLEATEDITLSATLQTAGSDSATTVTNISKTATNQQRSTWSIPLPANSLVSGSNLLTVSISDGTNNTTINRTIPIQAVGSNDGTTVVFD